MLIDGGESAYGETIHDYIANLALPAPLDHIVLTHYNEDHAGGLRSLVLADDLSSVVDTLTVVAAPQANGNNNRAQIAAVVAAVYSAALGNYGPNVANANHAAGAARANPGANQNAAVAKGVIEALNQGQPHGVALLIANPARRRYVARRVGLQAAASIAAGQVGAALTNSIETAIFDALRNGVLDGARFRTGNAYNGTHVIDNGAFQMPAGWDTAIAGDFTIVNNAAHAPGTARLRTPVPNLGSEVLWNSGPNPVAAPPAAPMAFVVSRAARAWQGQGVPPFNIATGFPDNDTSIGLIIRFNNFFYYTAGDLPLVGENPLMNAVMANGLPNPAGGAPLPVPNRFWSFKCSHHGAATATSAVFLGAANPRTALISAGNNPSYQHPSDAVLFRLHGEPNLRRFYLTNCNFQSIVVPASMGNVQLVPGNKSRVSGDSHQDNFHPGRPRGNIRLRITQAGSMGAVGARQFAVRYWEEDQIPAGLRVDTFTF